MNQILEEKEFHGMAGTRTYRAWHRMKVYSKTSEHLAMQDSWNKFSNFFKDMGICPDGHKLRKIDFQKGYSKNNCVWALAFVPKEMRYKQPKLLSTWKNMISRCHNPKDAAFSYYGGRGIEVCKEWRESFNAFLADMGDREKGLTIDRIDNEKGYCKENCRWITMAEQNLNKRPRKSGGNLLGVKRDNKTKVSPYSARIRIEGISYHLGLFASEVEAHCEYLKMYREWYGFFPKYIEIPEKLRGQE